jgi:hypothetical protein
MSDFPLIAGTESLAVGRNTSSASQGIAVTSGAANTKGSYAQLIATTTQRMDGFWFHWMSITNTDGLVDVAIGASGSEALVVENMAIASANACDSVWVPLEIPKGVRVAVRWQAVTASSTIHVGLSALLGGFRTPRAFQRAATFGANTATSRGVSVDAGGTANTFGAWTEIVAATAFPLRALYVGHQRTGDFTQIVQVLLDIGYGAAGGEITLIHQLMGYNDGTDNRKTPTGTHPVHVPAGSRLVARLRADNNANNANRRASVSLIGFG